MRRAVKLAPLPEPTPAAADQDVPLVQVTLKLPVASAFEPEIGLTLPNETLPAETVQFAVTVASTLSVELATAAEAADGARATAHAASK
jgi:hypothetical protein